MAYSLSEQAVLDMVRIYKIGTIEFGLAQADRYHEELDSTFDLIFSNPRLARLRTELSYPVRVYRFRAHVIIYTIGEENQVLILRVRHGREDWVSDPASSE